MAGWLHSDPAVSRFAFICLLAAGCFYGDPINQRPSIEIVTDSSTTPHRGDHVKLHASVNDPENQFVTLTWHAQACEKAEDLATCDKAFFSWIGDHPDITIPSRLEDGITSVQSLRVVLEAQDDHGATAKPTQVLVVPLADIPPDLALSKRSLHGSVVGVPIDFYAKVGDADDGPDAVTLDWVVFSPPSQPASTLIDIPNVPQDLADHAHITTGKRFVPMGVGDWDIQVTATDPQTSAHPDGVSTVQHLLVSVVPDHAPCLGTVAPLAAPVGQALPLYDPTLFAVLVVNDDLDVFPANPSDPLFGDATFHWSLLAPGATTRQPLAGVISNSFAIDPASYTPGDFVELRVEIEDRNHTPITCADGSPTCSVISDPSCVQRLTWRMEIR
ncbi:MAG: hypothetical protein JWO36_2090 [Myxococcales bacterium]|nr:hypothetical protein [Myxococcales bacterium]